MIYEKQFAQECKPDGYQPPRTVRTVVEAEDCFCASATIESKEDYVVVEEYSSIENDVTFE